MDYGLIVSTAAILQPITIQEAKLHCKVTHDDENGYIETLIDAANDSTENDCRGRAWVNRTMQMTLAGFPSWTRFSLPRSPVSGAANDTVITYQDLDNVEQTLATTVYGVDATPIVPVVYLKDGQSWPSTLGTEPAVVTIQFVAGYGATRETVPPRAKQAINLAVMLWYAQRSPVVTGTIATKIPLVVSSLLDGLRIPRVAA